MTNEDRTLAARPSVGRGFWSAAVAITAIVLSANTPLPLLTVYQSQWGFSTALLSIVYGLYTVGVVTTVFLVGPMSDHVGRKRILIPSLFLMALGLVTCLLSPNVWVLMGGRVLQGLAVGAEFGPAPTVLPYLAALLFVFVTLIAVARAPETVRDARTARSTTGAHSHSARYCPSVLSGDLCRTHGLRRGRHLRRARRIICQGSPRNPRTFCRGSCGRAVVSGLGDGPADGAPVATAACNASRALDHCGWVGLFRRRPRRALREPCSFCRP